MSPRNRCAKIVRDCEQMIRDVESWNDNRTDMPPMDCEPERVMLPVARACLAAWDAGDVAGAGALARRLADIAVSGAR